MAATQVYYGEVGCSATVKSTGNPCSNKSYYITKKNELLCGVHSKNVTKDELPKRPESEKAQMKEDMMLKHQETVEHEAEKNRKAGLFGDVMLVKFMNRRAVQMIPGYLNVFPNNKHQNRSEGFGCASLSPMQLGPVDHGQPDCPPAKLLENFHQGNKVFSDEVDENNDPTDVFVTNRLKWYCDEVPHRHKVKGVKPLFSIWTDRDGESYKIDYISSRQFYCTFYERLVKEKEDFRTLVELREEGVNLAIHGHDAAEMEMTAEGIERAYLDKRSQFGHEKCLAALLVLDEKDYPWIKHLDFVF